MSILHTNHHSAWPMVALTGAAAALALLLTFDTGALRISDDGGPIRARVAPQPVSTGAAVAALDFEVIGSPNHRTLAPSSAMAMNIAGDDIGPPRRAKANGVRVPPK